MGAYGSGPYKVQALVLGGRACGESDRIYSLISPEVGRLDAVARGVRASRRGRGGRLEPFCCVSLQLHPGVSLPTISQVELTRSFRVVETLEALATATYMCELYQELTPPGAGSAARRAYAGLHRTLSELEVDDPAWLRLLCRRGELRLAAILGTAPAVDACVACRGQSERWYFSAQMGGLLCACCHGSEPAARELSTAAVRLLRLLSCPEAQSLRDLAPLVDPATHGSLERALRSHLEWHWPHTLSSRSFVHQVGLLTPHPEVATPSSSGSSPVGSPMPLARERTA